MPDVRLFDSRDLRRVLGTFVTGVTVVTTTDDEGGFHGVTANSFSSVSLDPPLVLWSQAVKSHSHPAFFKAERFAVNILAEDQIELSKRFAKSSPEKFAGIDVDIGSGGVPLLRGCSARLQCRVVSRVPGGDHTIYVGEVHAIDRAERKPLVFGNGQYLLADPHDLADSALSPNHKQAQLCDAARRTCDRAPRRQLRRDDGARCLGHSRSDDYPLGAGVRTCERGSSRRVDTPGDLDGNRLGFCGTSSAGGGRRDCPVRSDRAAGRAAGLGAAAR